MRIEFDHAALAQVEVASVQTWTAYPEMAAPPSTAGAVQVRATCCEVAATASAVG